MERTWVRNTLVGAALLAVYVAAGKVGLSLASVNPSVTAVWAPTGVTIAAFLVLGTRFWPVILAGAYIVNITTAGTPVTSLAIALGNTAEGLVGAYLVESLADGRRAFDRVRTVFVFVAVAAIGATMISATVGVATLAFAGFAEWGRWGWIWLTWWLGDGVGALVVTPVLVLWANQRRLGWTRHQAFEAALIVVTIFGLGALVFFADRRYPLEYLAIPAFGWAAFRLGPRESAAAVLLFTIMSVWGTVRGYGPFVVGDMTQSLLLLQAFSGVTAATILGLSADVTERRRAERQLRELSVRDPLTGLSNYRHFMTMLAAEVTRAERLERPFSLIMLDLDDLKMINDRHGHIVGSRVLCRLAAALQDSSRAMDLTARYGGDEFAVILAEAGEDVARQVSKRVKEQIAADREAPPFTASIGRAVYPRDGKTVEELLVAADRALYAAKAELPRAAVRA